MPVARYSPWNLDRDFRAVYAIARDHTLVDYYRCFDLWKLVEQSAKLVDGHFIEIGVWRGGSGAIIAKQAQRCAIPAQVYLCDTFAGVVKAGNKDSRYAGGEYDNTSKKMVEELVVNQLQLDNVRILEGIFPDDTGAGLEDLKFRFCHIDVDVYQSAKDIMAWIWDRMVPGGMIVYDDYSFTGCDGITKYVNEQMLEPDRVVTYNLNGHALVIKR